MIEQILKDPSTQINENFFAVVLGDNLTLWNNFNEELRKYDIEIEWRFYKDGGWLGKALNKKKTIFWGSLSENTFSAGFNFSNKPSLREGLLTLEISEDIKNSIEDTPSGKFFGFRVDITDESQLSDLYTLINYKKKAK